MVGSRYTGAAPTTRYRPPTTHSSPHVPPRQLYPELPSAAARAAVGAGCADPGAAGLAAIVAAAARTRAVQRVRQRTVAIGDSAGNGGEPLAGDRRHASAR